MRGIETHLQREEAASDRKRTGRERVEGERKEKKRGGLCPPLFCRLMIYLNFFSKKSFNCDSRLMIQGL